MTTQWQEWLEEELQVGLEWVRRRKLIHQFVVHGLIPLLKEHGYTMHGSNDQIQSYLASGLFANRHKHLCDSDWSGIPFLNKAPFGEDLDHYNHVLDQRVWDQFWDGWSYWEDVSTETPRGWDRRQDIQNFVWSQLNLEESPQTIVVTEHIWGDEEPSEENDYHHRRTDRKEDSYLRDAAESNEWGGYRRTGR